MCYPLYIQRDTSDKTVKIHGLITERELQAYQCTIINPILPIFSQNIWNLWFVNRIVVVNEGAFLFIFNSPRFFISENNARNSTGRSSHASSLYRLVGSLQLPSYINLTDQKR